MSHTIGVEQLPYGGALVWVLDLPGCAVELPPGVEPMTAAVDRIDTYLAWREGFHGEVSANGRRESVGTSETLQPAEGDLQRAFFPEDKALLTADDAFEVGWLLDLSHRELMGVVQLMASELYGREPVSEAWSDRRRELLELIRLERHLLAGTCGCTLEPGRNETLPDMLIATRQTSMDCLASLVGQQARHGESGEGFSGRKLTRLLIHHDLAAARNLRMEAARG